MKPNNVTARNFTDPILRVLGDLTGYDAENSAKSKVVIAETCKFLGLDENEWGEYKKNRLWTHELIGQALATLKRNGLAINPKRGVWTLTEAGRDAARKLQDTPFTTPGTDKVAAMTAAVAQTAKVNQTAGAFSVELVEDTVGDLDEDLQVMLQKSAECFSHYDATDDACKGCAVRGSCQGAMLVKLADLARHIKREDEKRAEVARNADAAAEAVDEKISELVEKPKKGDASEVTAWMSAVCTKCGKQIEKGSKAMWKVGEGMWHIECHTA